MLVKNFLNRPISGIDIMDKSLVTGFYGSKYKNVPLCWGLLILHACGSECMCSAVHIWVLPVCLPVCHARALQSKI